MFGERFAHEAKYDSRLNEGRGMNSATTINMQSVAYAKIFLHASKYPSAPVGGYLIGTQTTKSVRSLKIVDI